jgi:hypothetical protein
MKKLWEIYVPTMRKNGNPIRVRHHQVWDRTVRKITGGLTILKPAIGYWDSPGGELYRERMIPVRIVATEDEMNQIIDATFKHYPDEEAILSVEISDKVILRHRDEFNKT